MKRHQLYVLCGCVGTILFISLACNLPTTISTTPTIPTPSDEVLVVTGSGSIIVSSGEAGVLTTDSGAQLEIPNGAVPPAEDGSPGTAEFSMVEDFSMTMELSPEFTKIGPVYRLLPEGTAFGMPVKLTLPIPSDVDAGYVMGIATFNEFSGTWQLLPAAVDEAARTVVAEVGHFSYYGAFGLSAYLEAGESWAESNGGWFDIVNTARDGLTTAPFGKPLPASVYYGVCVQTVTYDDPTAESWNWQRPTDWMIGATAQKNQDSTREQWLPAGTYTLMEMYGIGETNNYDIFYYPEHRYYVRPMGQVVLGDGERIQFYSPIDINFGDLENQGFTWSKHPCWLKPMDTPPVEPGDNWTELEVINTHRHMTTKTHFGKRLPAGVYYGVCSPNRVYDDPQAETWNWRPPLNWMMGVSALEDRDASYTYKLPAGNYSLLEVYHLVERGNTDYDYVPEGRYYYRPVGLVPLLGGQTITYTSPAVDPGPAGDWGQSLVEAGFSEDSTNPCYQDDSPISVPIYGNIEFRLGPKSFADQVVDFNPGSGTGESDGSAAVGPPDGGTGGPSIIGDPGDVTLGNGGSITLKFTDNYLIDVEGLDLYVFEYGDAVEPFRVEISKDGLVWIDLGTVSGQPTGLDIYDKVNPIDRFSYVRITDPNPYAPQDPSEIGTEGYYGPDIDAVGAIGAVGRPDSDVDGVPDDEDMCSDTPLGSVVDGYGCP
ncbi:MAG: hypothetical protein K8R77_09405 [Anaerolineaceae bacterium]|nr:hypothetical protein [Anaerolineaceae bacterium]